MEKELLEIKELLDKNKNKWIKSNRKKDTGIGKTFEDLLEKKEDNLSIPDLGKIEIKTQRKDSDSYVTLFTKSPRPRGSINKIKNNYGVFHELNNKFIYTTIKADSFNSFNKEYQFKINIDYKNEKIVILIYKNNQLINKDYFWYFKDIEECLKKIENTAFIQAKSKKESDQEYFKYSSLQLLLNVDLITFLKAIEKGYVVVDIRVGIYKEGKRLGKSHDHGTAFRIKKQNFFQIFKNVINV